MSDSKISQDLVANPFTWDGTEALPGIKAGANGAGLVSALRTFFATLNQAQNEAPPVTIASSGSVGIGAAAANTITVSGTNTITSFDTISAGAWRRVVFSGILTLTHNATTLILPGGANITTGAGDSGEFLSLGSGNWKCVSYTRANGSALTGSAFTGGTLTAALNEAPQVTIASAATTDIGAATANSVSVTGTTTITGLGTIPNGALRRVVFAGILILTYNATSLILPGSANITTAAGDVAWFESLGSGNWRCVGYHRASGASLAGASVTGFTAALLTASPNNTTNTSQFLASGGTTDQDAVLQPKGSGYKGAQAPDNSSAGGNKRGTYATDWQSSRTTATMVASGVQAAIGGGDSNTASGNQSTIAGGTTNQATGLEAAIGGGNSNQATTRGATVAGGLANIVNTSNYGACGGGNGNTVSGLAATSPGGDGNTATGDYSHASGKSATTRGLYGMHAQAAGTFGSGSRAQRGSYVLRRSTTNATATVLTLDGGTPAAATNIQLANNTTYTFHALLVARDGTTPDNAGWEIKGVITKGTSAASTAFVGTPTSTSLGASTGAGSWAAAVIVETTTFGCLQIQVTGAAGKNINWVAVVTTAETDN